MQGGLCPHLCGEEGLMMAFHESVPNKCSVKEARGVGCGRKEGGRDKLTPVSQTTGQLLQSFPSFRPFT